MAKGRIEESATKKQGRIDSCQDIIVGVNKYKLKDEELVSGMKIDNDQVRNSQIAGINKIKETRNPEEVKRCLQQLEESAMLDEDVSTSKGTDPNNLLGLAVACAAARCTVGEISDALERAWGRHVPTGSVVRGAYSASFNESGEDNQKEYENVLDEVKQFEKDEGRRPRILVAKMGQDGHDRGAKVISSGFSDLGYDVDVGALFSTPEEVALQAIDNDVHVIGVSSQANGHQYLVPELVKALKKLGGGDIVVVVGGVIPKEDYDSLYEQGAGAIFGPGTRITDAASEVLGKIPRGRV